MKTREVECIQRLLEKGLYYEMRDYIVESKFAKLEDFDPLTRDFEKAMFICSCLHKASEEEKLILLDYEWVLLPLEFIKVTCVSETDKKEFIHGL